MKIFVLNQTLSAVSALLLSCGAIHGQSVDSLLEKGDAFDSRFQAAQALEFYLPAEKLQPNDTQILLRIARQYRHLMADAGDRHEKERLGGLALNYAQRAAALAPQNSEAQLGIAITYGKMLSFQGNRERVEASRRIKTAADRAIQLDPSNDTAWHMLGRWHRVLSEFSSTKKVVAQLLYGKLPKATNTDAEKCFEKAISLNPNRLMHYIELGRTYAQMGRTEEARRYLSKGLSMPAVEKDDPESKQMGRQTLAKLR